MVFKKITSPRKVVFDTIGKKDNVLDLCTGTATNAIAIAKKNPNARAVVFVEWIQMKW